MATEKDGDAYHSTWRIPIIAHNTIRKTSMICPNTHCPTVLFTFLDQRSKNLVLCPERKTGSTHYYVTSYDLILYHEIHTLQFENY